MQNCRHMNRWIFGEKISLLNKLWQDSNNIKSMSHREYSCIGECQGDFCVKDGIGFVLKKILVSLQKAEYSKKSLPDR